MEVDKELKRKITQRWKILAGAQGDAQEAAAYAQLEYILTEAGLLARTRKKRHEFGKISPTQGDHTRETSPGDRLADAKWDAERFTTQADRDNDA